MSSETKVKAIQLKLVLSFCYFLLITACSGPVEETGGRRAQKSSIAKFESVIITSSGQESIQRQPFFGDLHVHTSWSLDSYVNFNHVDPDQAYRFARGEAVTIAGDRRLQLDRPQDFAAVTEHAEYLGELSLCLDRAVTQYELPLCRDIRYDTNGNNLHRNIIFRNSHVPTFPVSYFEANTPTLLWQQLKDGYQPPCEVLAIPHNSNQSRGRQFPTMVTLADAQLRRGLEPLVEIIQTKGESECRTGVGTADEFCNFEKLERGSICQAGENKSTTSCVRVCSEEEDGTAACIFKVRSRP